MTMTPPPDAICELLSEYLDTAPPEADLLAWSRRLSDPKLFRTALCELLAATAEQHDAWADWLRQKFADDSLSVTAAEQKQTLRAMYRDWSTLREPLKWAELSSFGFLPHELCLQHAEDYRPLGAQLGQWTLESRIGVGGFAVVFSASSTRNALAAALKIPRREDNQQKTALNCRRLESEACLLAGLQVDGVPQLREHFIDEFGPVVVTELVVGTRWDNLYFPDLTLKRQIEIFIQLVKTVDRVHRCGLVHGDIKQQNVLIDADGKPWLLDFNVARHSSPDQPQSQDNVGTLGLMSPEAMLTADDAPDLRRDLYSLGTVLYELTTGKTWIHAQGREDALVAAIIQGGSPSSLFTDDTPITLRKIIETAVSHEEFRRYETAIDMAENLKEWLVNPESKLQIPVINAPLAAWRLGQATARFGNRCRSISTILEHSDSVPHDQPLPQSLRDQFGNLMGISLAASEMASVAGLLGITLSEFSGSDELSDFFYRARKTTGRDVTKLRMLLKQADHWFNSAIETMQFPGDANLSQNWQLIELAILTQLAPRSKSARESWPQLAQRTKLPPEITLDFSKLCRRQPAAEHWNATLQQLNHEVVQHLRWQPHSDHAC